MKFLRLLLISLALPLAAFAAANPYVNGTVSNSAVLVKVPPNAGQPLFLDSVACTNDANQNTGACIQFFDAATAGAVTPGSTVPTYVLYIPRGGVLDKDLTSHLPFYNGIVICITTTWNGSTALGSATPITLTYE